MDNNQIKVRTRIAPSPTGFWHIGNTRTGLFNFLITRKKGGSFILRIEDTDRERYLPEAVDNIIEALHWLGLEYDEGPTVGGEYGPYTQSERLELYKKHANELLEKDLAYVDEGAMRFKTTKEGITTWRDLIGDREITFENKTQEDFVILKTDGYPTYNFANIIDDHYMEISLVIRGEEFISSTPKHLMLYKAFGWEPPKFAHAPLILGSDRSKLSKRHGAKSVLEFRDDGYLPEAILNFMALLCWTPPSGKEILSVKEMIEEFDLKDVNTVSPIFDITKLDWMNGVYIRKISDEELTKRLQEYLVDHPDKNKIAPIFPLIKERIKKLSDFIPLTHFIFSEPEYDIEVFNKLRIENTKDVIKKVQEKLESIKSPWDAKEFEETFRNLSSELNIPASNMFQLIRVVISGQLVTPPLFESMEIIGEEKVLNRFEKVLLLLPD